MEDLTPKEIMSMLRNAAQLKLTTERIEQLAEMLHRHKESKGGSKKEIDAMLNKPARDRYIYSVKRIAEREEAWTLKDADGNIASFSDNVDNLFYIWPYKEYALKCAYGEWKNYKLFRLPLNNLLEKTLPNLSKEGIQVAVFQSPSDSQTVAVSADDFLNNLLYECSQYE